MSGDEQSNIRRSRRSIKQINYKEGRTNRTGSDESDASEFEYEENNEKAKLLFDNERDIEGEQIYTFRTPKKKNALSNIAQSVHKTPNHIRMKVKKAISKNLRDNGSSGEDFSADESEYSPSEEENSVAEVEDSSSEGEESKSEPEEEPVAPKRGRKKIPINLNALNTPKAPTRGRKPKSQNENQCFIESEKYFQSNHKNKVLTSDHTLDLLRTNQLPQSEVENMLKNIKLSNTHRKEVLELQKDCRKYFQKWMVFLNEDFNILLYGLGSKRSLINEFHDELIQNHPALIVNGFFPGLTLQDILNAICNDILEISSPSANPHECVSAIESEMAEIPETHLFLLIHNLDGPNLRSSKAQDILSRLSRIKNIHLIASIDHINAPLLWDHSKISNFNFTWFDVTTMEPYWAETKFETSVIGSNSGNLVLSSMKNVFHSLTSNSKGIYFLIVKHQLNNNNQNYQGMSFKELYSSCRDAFLVSSDIALRSQLTEFTDHKLVKIKRAADGTEYLSIPIQSNLLQRFMDENQ